MDCCSESVFPGKFIFLGWRRISVILVGRPKLRGRPRRASNCRAFLWSSFISVLHQLRTPRSSKTLRFLTGHQCSSIWKISYLGNLIISFDDTELAQISEDPRAWWISSKWISNCRQILRAIPGNQRASVGDSSTGRVASDKHIGTPVGRRW